MRFAGTILGFALVAHSVSAHYIFDTLIYGDKTSTAAVRKPQNNSPVKPLTSSEMTCNANPIEATETVKVAAGSKIGFQVYGNTTIFHAGPAAIYLGQAPGAAADWDGSGVSWFKIAQWGATFDPLTFLSLGKRVLVTTIPKDTPAGEYLVRVEQHGLHIIPPESFMSCAQIHITGTGTGKPSHKVAIPGPQYINEDDSSVNVNIYFPVPTHYNPPGPRVWRG